MAERASRQRRIPTYPLFALVLLGALGFALVRSGIGPDTASAPPSTTTTAAVTEVTTRDAIESWLAVHRDEMFPTFEGGFIGDCDAVAAGDVPNGLCSTILEDLGDHQIHIVGVYATDWGGDLLLEHGARGWAVVASSPWPELGDESYLGTPWSPLTAISGWWRDHGSEHYGDAQVVHLRSCDEASPVPGSDQVLVCSTLVRDAGGTREYASGRAGEPADVVLLVEAGPDHTWSVASAATANGELPG